MLTVNISIHRQHELSDMSLITAWNCMHRGLQSLRWRNQQNPSGFHADFSAEQHTDFGEEYVCFSQ